MEQQGGATEKVVNVCITEKCCNMYQKGHQNENFMSYFTFLTFRLLTSAILWTCSMNLLF